jgi:photosystem II stability/assembly factor-like uncharacterized protein
MKHIILLLGLMSYPLLAQQSGWTWQNPLPQGNPLKDLCFVDSLHGWAVGYNGTVMRTVNGGTDWKVLSTNFKSFIGKVCFLDQDKGWLMSYYDNIIYHTIDGGLQWDSIACLHSSPQRRVFLDFLFIDDTLGFACGTSKIARTNNGGHSWEFLSTSVYQDFQSITFTNSSVGWAAGTGPYIIKTTDGGMSWNEILLPVPPYDFCAGKIYFINDSYGFIGGNVSDYGVLLRTIDGGIGWAQRIFPNEINDIYFSSPEFGWVKEIMGDIYYTSDGGYNWTKRHESCSRFYFTANDKAWGIFSMNLIRKTVNGWETSELQTPSVTTENLWSVDVLDSQNVVACGENIIGTTDGGRNWGKYYPSDGYLYDIRYLSEDEIWAVGENGTAIFTKDGGKLWHEINLGPDHLYSIDYVKDTLGYILGTNRSDDNIILHKTMDGGNTWHIDTTFSNMNSTTKLRFASSELGWVGTSEGILLTTNAGKTWKLVYHVQVYFTDISIIGNHAWFTHSNWVLFTTDAGKSWQDIKVYDLHPTTPRYIESISFSDTLNGWITLQGGEIYNTNNGWAVGSDGIILCYGDRLNPINFSNNLQIPRLYHLRQNYPNPFNSFTTITFDLPKTSEVILKVYNILGEEVATLVSNKLSAGSHTYKWDAGNLGSGIYLYRLEAGEYVEARKMVLMR